MTLLLPLLPLARTVRRTMGSRIAAFAVEDAVTI
jgi:hypothetical protein